MTKINTLLYLSILFLLLSGSNYAQDEVEFKMQNQFYLKGDAFYIGNNILSKNPTTPYTSFSVINDAISMKYIDVDKNPSTFSSSSSSFSLKDQKARIVSATLYWTAIYPYSKGSRGVKNNEYYYKKSEDRLGDFTQVKFKTPENKTYQDIKGKILFDGLLNENYLDSAPYVCYADVTNLMPSKSNGSGVYTVANIRATEGFVSGGSSAGWLLFVVYESNEKEPRYISSYNGFSSLSENHVDIEFKDFKTKSSGLVNATVFVATLEGDSKLNEDQFGIMNPKSKKYQYLQNKLRAQTNFFNGKMTIDNRYFTKRNPNGSSTLGFDVLKLKLPQELMLNSQTNTSVRLSSNKDRFYFYFSAFKTEINKDFYKEKIENKLKKD